MNKAIRSLSRSSGHLDVDGVPFPEAERGVRDRVAPSVESWVRANEAVLVELVRSGCEQDLAERIRSDVVAAAPDLAVVDGYAWRLDLAWDQQLNDLDIILQVLPKVESRDLA